MSADTNTNQRKKRENSKVARLTAQEIIEENKRIYAENNIKNLDDLNAFTLKERLENKGE